MARMDFCFYRESRCHWGRGIVDKGGPSTSYIDEARIGTFCRAATLRCVKTSLATDSDLGFSIETFVQHQRIRSVKRYGGLIYLCNQAIIMDAPPRCGNRQTSREHFESDGAKK
jgi:hypothetical protein